MSINCRWSSKPIVKAVVLSLLVVPSGPVLADLIEDFNVAGPSGSYVGANFAGLPGHPNAMLPPFETGPDAVSTGEFLRLKEFTSGGFQRSFNGVGFDQTDPGSFGRIIVDFDFRITVGGTRVAGSGFDFRGADGFSMALMQTGTFGTTGIPFTLGENGTTAGGQGAPSQHQSFALGFDTFDNGNGFSNNFVNLVFNGSFVPLSVIDLNPTGFDIVTGGNRVRGDFHHAHIDLVLGGASQNVTVELTDSGGTMVTPFLNFDLSSLIVGGLPFGPYDSRLGFFTRTGDSQESVDLDNIRVQYLSPIGAAGAIPEPSTLALFAIGLAGLGFMMRRRRSMQLKAA